VDRIATGYLLAEAPVTTSDGGLCFSDALGGGVYRWSPANGEVEAVIPERKGVGGALPHRDGGLVVSGRDVIHVNGGHTRTLYTDPGIAGISDITADPEGRLVAGNLRYRPFKGEAMVPGEFVQVDAGGAVTMVAAGIEWVNGCAFSPHGTTFYGCDYGRGLVLAADRAEDGGYGPVRTVVTAPGGECDGMAVDEHGALWVALGSRRTVGRFAPDGTPDLEIEVPANFVASLCFGGADLRDLFITTTGDPQDPDDPGGVFVTRSPVAGAPVHACAI
jgi:gluconolactonase